MCNGREYYDNISELPSCEGVYIVSDRDSPCATIYIGRSENVFRRWNNLVTPHHRLEQIQRDYKRFWIQVIRYENSFNFSLSDMEAWYIAVYNPLLNGTPVLKGLDLSEDRAPFNKIDSFDADVSFNPLVRKRVKTAFGYKSAILTRFINKQRGFEGFGSFMASIDTSKPLSFVFSEYTLHLLDYLLYDDEAIEEFGRRNLDSIFYINGAIYQNVVRVDEIS